MQIYETNLPFYISHMTLRCPYYKDGNGISFLAVRKDPSDRRPDLVEVRGRQSDTFLEKSVTLRSSPTIDSAQISHEKPNYFLQLVSHMLLTTGYPLGREVRSGELWEAPVQKSPSVLPRVLRGKECPKPPIQRGVP